MGCHAVDYKTVYALYEMGGGEWCVVADFVFVGFRVREVDGKHFFVGAPCAPAAYHGVHGPDGTHAEYF